jgi:Fe-S cluster biosynthesis and repair protein YggX
MTSPVRQLAGLRSYARQRQRMSRANYLDFLDYMHSYERASSVAWAKQALHQALIFQEMHRIYSAEARKYLFKAINLQQRLQEK